MKGLLFLITILGIATSCTVQNSLEKEKQQTAKKENDTDILTPEQHHYLGIELNMQTWNLLTKENLDRQDKERMIQFAYGSLFHWKFSPMYSPVNEQRGEWLISHVFAILNAGNQSLEHAEKCMKITEDEKLTGFDLAYAYEAMARSYAILQDDEKKSYYSKLAEEAGNNIENDEDKSLFFSDFKSGVLK